MKLEFGMKIVIALAIAVLASGCMEAPKPEAHIAKSSDKYMMKSMIKYVKWGTRNPDIIVKKVYISGLKGHIDRSVQSAYNEYGSKFDIMSENMTKDYIKAAKQRGSTVKLYKNSVSHALAKATPRSFSIERGYDGYNYSLDPALIEYSKNGKIISVMLQKHKVSSMNMMSGGKGFLHYRYSEIITGKSASKLEYSIGNDILSNGFIRKI